MYLVLKTPFLQVYTLVYTSRYIDDIKFEIRETRRRTVGIE